MNPLLERGAETRATAGRYASPAARPSQRRFADDAPVSGTVRVSREFTVRGASSSSPVVVGYASTTEQPYEMWDAFGPYTEVVELAAFDDTLAMEGLLVEFTLNHGAGGGIPMAHTRNATLTLEARKDGDETGLWYEANVDGRRHDVSDAVMAMERGDLAESSFKFRITSGQWSPDWMEYHIKAVDLHRGDVSAVNFGANPFTSSGLKELAAPDGAVLAVPNHTGSIYASSTNGVITLKQDGTPSQSPVAIAPEDTARRVLILDADTRRRTLT